MRFVGKLIFADWDAIEEIFGVQNMTDTELTSRLPEGQDHREINPKSGQQKAYVVLTEEERAKGFVRPVRTSYVHVGISPVFDGAVLKKYGKNGCGMVTTMATEIAETYARDPHFYSGTFCTRCREHRPLNEFTWEGTQEQVGS